MDDGTKIAAAIMAVEAARQMNDRAPKQVAELNDPSANLMGYFQRFAREIEKASTKPKG